MLVETGRVVAVESGALWVETIRQSTCGSCAANKGCGHGLLNRMSDGRTGYVRVLSGAIEARECTLDDQVRIAIPEHVILRGSLILYMLPVAAMLAGSATAQNLSASGSELAAVAGAVLGLAAGFAAVRWHAWRHRHDSSLQPTLLEILPRATLPLRPA